MKLLKLTLLITLFSLCSCGSSLTTVSKKYPATMVNNITVFNPGELVPNTSEVIGTVRLKSAGALTDKKYNKLVEKAKIATARAGGNGLMLNEYSYNDGTSVIAGNMLYLSDMEVDSTAPNLAMESEVIYKNQVEEYKRKYKVPSSTFSINGGYGWIVSELYSADLYRMNPLGGAELRAEYNYTFMNGLGTGILYSGFFRTIDNQYRAFKMNISYVGPTITYAHRFDRIILRAGYGLGIAFYDESTQKSTGFGTSADIKAEYRLSNNIGINITATAISCIFPSSYNRDYDIPYAESYNSFYRVSLTGGLCFYF